MRRRQPQRKAPQFTGNSTISNRNMACPLTTPTTTVTPSDSSSRVSTELDRPLCRFYVLHKGRCRHGRDCAYSHILPEGVSWEEAKKLVPCPFFVQGTCRYGEHCQLRHDPQDLVTHSPSCAVASLEGTCTTTMDADLQEDNKKEENAAVVCGICLEEKPRDDPLRRQTNRRFGLLSCCNHAFCYDCLMEWRKEGSQDASDRKSCPTCRKHSDYVVPSPVFPSCDEQKHHIVQRYKDKLAVIPCRRFQVSQRLGSCPFGSDCFYAHIDELGRDVKAMDASMEELARQRERIQDERRRRRQHDAHIAFLGVTESNLDDVDVLLSFFRLLHVYGYRGTSEFYWSDEEDEDGAGGDDNDDDDNDNDDTNLDGPQRRRRNRNHRDDNSIVMDNNASHDRNDNFHNHFADMD